MHLRNFRYNYTMLSGVRKAKTTTVGDQSARLFVFPSKCFSLLDSYV